MKFSVLHISDLHRDLSDEVPNGWLLDSLARDFDQFDEQTPKITMPKLCIISGDLVHGVSLNVADPGKELMRQYVQAEEFFVGLADRFFNGDRERIVILPGNHDVCLSDVMASFQRIEIPIEPEMKARLVKELFTPNSELRWSWREMCFFRITNSDMYRDRFRYFASTYNSFYQGKRTYQLTPEQQFDVFDFADLGFCVVALNSCFNNDPLRRVGSFHPNTLTEACRALRNSSRVGWLTAVAWHHNLVGGPTQDDYLDAGFLQLLIDAGASLGFHGHQHLPECFDERYRLGNNPRKMTIVSASTLCAEPKNLRPGVPRSYNIVELDTGGWVGCVHQRQMVNMQMPLPVWGPGHFINTNNSFFDFEICKPLATRSSQLDVQLALDQADKLLGAGLWHKALEILEEIKEVPLARPLLVKALEELGDERRTITEMWPPRNNAEAVILGGAVLNSATTDEAEAFVRLELVSDNTDASVRDISRRIVERRLK
ncbi:MAG: metallophosphoesterase family protein [Methylophilaceae bacterium]